MPYSDEDFERMETDPVLARQYFWFCGMRARAEACRLRRRARQMPLEDGFDAVKRAEHLDWVASAVLENLEVLVRSTVAHGDLNEPSREYVAGKP